MQDYQRAFLRLALDHGVLRFGEFTLKSGRVSPYFFNAGLFNTGQAIAGLGRFYAKTIAASALSFDMLFGPAYKGIPLAVVTAAALAENHDRNVPFAFNRKESKNHGEGGNLVGAPMEGQVLILDDVITAGTAIREAVELITHHGAKPAGVVIALDREERGTGPRSAVQEAEETLDVPVISIVKLADLVVYVEEDETLMAYLPAVTAYRAEFGV